MSVLKEKEIQELTEAYMGSIHVHKTLEPLCSNMIKNMVSHDAYGNSK